MEGDFDSICTKIEDVKDFLNTVSQEIWRKPELKFEEFQAHSFLTSTFEKLGFKVKRHYLLDTAFKAEYVSNRGLEVPAPTVAILLEYDALPGIGHACGHNLITEVGLGAAMAVKEIMDKDPTLEGKLVVLGTPAEEGGGGKIRLIEKGAFEGLDIALMVHPTRTFELAPVCLCNIRGSIVYRGKEAHSAFSPWEGLNALDAAVLCYNSIAVLRQQLRPDQRIHVILKEGGVSTSIIPAKSRLDFAIRTPTAAQLLKLRSRLEVCINSAASATGCSVDYDFDDSTSYTNLISNKVLVDLYEKYFAKLGLTLDDVTAQKKSGSGSTDMGNVSHVVPSYHPFFPIPSAAPNHTKEFTEASGSPAAQPSTLNAAKVVAMTAVSVLRSPDLMKKVQEQFKRDVLNELDNI